MSKIYQGKELCQGCGRSGEEIYRNNKNSLCSECKDALQLGKSAIKHKDPGKYITVTGIRTFSAGVKFSIEKKEPVRIDNGPYVSGFGYDSYEYGNDEDVKKALEALIKSVSVGQKEEHQGELYFTDGAYYPRNTIKEETGAAIFSLIKALFAWGRNLELSSFNKGKNLLFMLNSGGITLADFDRRVSEMQKK